jgi:hypothetical protein
VGDGEGYRPPPPFAPPGLRTAPLNAAWSAAPTAAAAATHPVGHRRRALGAVLVAVAAAAVALTLLAVDRTTSPTLRKLSLPRAVAEFRLQRSLSQQEVDALASGGAFAGFGAEELHSAKVGIYTEEGAAEPRLVMVGLSARADPDVRARLATTHSDDLAAGVLVSLGASPAASADPGPLGGAVECGSMGVRGQWASIGVWADRSTVGILELLETRTTSATADLTRQFRAASEH